MHSGSYFALLTARATEYGVEKNVRRLQNIILDVDAFEAAYECQMQTAADPSGRCAALTDCAMEGRIPPWNSGIGAPQFRWQSAAVSSSLTRKSMKALVLSRLRLNLMVHRDFGQTAGEWVGGWVGVSFRRRAARLPRSLAAW